MYSNKIIGNFIEFIPINIFSTIFHLLHCHLKSLGSQLVLLSWHPPSSSSCTGPLPGQRHLPNIHQGRQGMVATRLQEVERVEGQEVEGVAGKVEEVVGQKIFQVKRLVAPH